MPTFGEFFYRAYIEPILHPRKAAEASAELGFFICAVLCVIHLIGLLLLVHWQAWGWVLFIGTHSPYTLLATKLAWDEENEDDDDDGPWGWLG